MRSRVINSCLPTSTISINLVGLSPSPPCFRLPWALGCRSHGDRHVGLGQLGRVIRASPVMATRRPSLCIGGSV